MPKKLKPCKSCVSEKCKRKKPNLNIIPPSKRIFTITCSCCNEEISGTNKIKTIKAWNSRKGQNEKTR